MITSLTSSEGQEIVIRLFRASGADGVGGDAKTVRRLLVTGGFGAAVERWVRLASSLGDAGGLDAVRPVHRTAPRAGGKEVGSISSNKRSWGPVVPELAAAGVVLILAAVGAARLALAPPADIPMSLTAWSVLMLLLAVVLAAAGIEGVRRRHFLFVVLVPAAPALVSLGYFIQTGQTAVLNNVWLSVVLMAMVASRRSDFA